MPRRVVPTRVSAFDEFANCVELLVQRQDQGGVLGNTQALRRDLDALPAEPIDFLEQGMRIEHDAVADDRQLAPAHDAGRQQRELVGDAVDNERVAGVMAALEADDDVGLLGQPIDDLALALVSPLGAHHDHIGHAAPFPPTTSVLADLAASNSDLAATRDRCRDILEATKACPELRPDGIRDHARRGKAMAPRRNDPVCGPTA